MKTLTNPETFWASVTQYMYPSGRAVQQQIDLPIEVQDEYVEMLKANCHLEAEVLQTSEVSITISNGEADIDISLTPNGPEVPKGMIEMLKRKSWEQNNNDE